MFRLLLLVVSLLSVTALSSAVAQKQDDKKVEDPLRKKLDDANLAYRLAVVDYRQGVGIWFDKREAAARKDGNKKVVDTVKAERKRFEEDGDVPKGIPKPIQEKFDKARAGVRTAYSAVVKEYTKAGQDDHAAATEKELEKTLLVSPGGDPEKATQGLLGKWNARVGPTFQTEWHFTADGVVTSTRGESKGTWRLDKYDGKTVVRIDWPMARAWDALFVPLDPKKTAGVSSVGPGARIEASKIDEAPKK